MHLLHESAFVDPILPAIRPKEIDVLTPQARRYANKVIAMVAKKLPSGVPHMTNDQMEELVTRLTHVLIRTRAPRSDWSRWIGLGALIISIFGVIFYAGGGWSKMNGFEIRIAAVETKQVEQGKQISDQAKDQALMLQEIRQVSAGVSEIKGQLQRPTGASR